MHGRRRNGCAEAWVCGRRSGDWDGSGRWWGEEATEMNVQAAEANVGVGVDGAGSAQTTVDESKRACSALPKCKWSRERGNFPRSLPSGKGSNGGNRNE
jgi:hypothetical protein